jgi:hypothetical protein
LAHKFNALSCLSLPLLHIHLHHPLYFFIFTQTQFTQDLEEEEEEAATPGGTAANAFDGTERVLAPKGDDPLDSARFRKRQDLKTAQPWTPEGEIGDLSVPVKGKNVKLAELLGEGATIVMNIKLDDPETITQIPALKTLVQEYKDRGLRAILIPTDQGDYEPDDSATVRIKVGQQFGLRSSSKGPVVVTGLKSASSAGFLWRI